MLLLFLCAAAAAQEAADAPRESLPREEEIEHLRVLTAYTLDGGEVEVNLVAEFLRFKGNNPASRDAVARVEVEFGVTDRLMVEFEYSYLFLRPEEGRSVNRPGGVELEVKGLFYDSGVLACAAGLAAGTAVEWEAEEEEFERSPSIEAFLPVSWAPFPWMRCHVAAGMEGVRHKAPERFVQAGVEILTWGEAVVFQMGFTSEAEGGEAPVTSAGPGFLLRLEEPEIRFGMGFPVGLSDAAPEWAILLNLEIELE